MSETIDAPPPTETTPPAPPAEQPGAAAPAPSLLGGEQQTPEQQQRARDEAGRFAPKAPEKYEFAAPEGIEVDPEALGGFETAAKEVGLTQEQFAKIAPLGAQLIAQKIAQAQAAAVPEFMRADRQNEWVAAVKADPEIGGDKLGPALVQAAKVFDQFDPNGEVRGLLSQSGLGNSPAMVRLFVAVGKAMGDAEGLGTGKPAAGAKPQSIEEQARQVYRDAGGHYPPAAA